MKKILAISITLLCLSFAAKAQIKSGDSFVGGNLLLSADNNLIGTKPTKDYTSSSFQIGPRVGYYFSSNFAFGVGVNVLASQTEDKSTYRDSRTTSGGLGLNVFARFLFINDEKFAVFADLGAGINSTMFEDKENDHAGATTSTKYTETMGNLRFAPGIIFFPSSNWGIEGSVGLLGVTTYLNKPDQGDKITGTNFQIGLNSGLNLGVHYYIRSK